LPVDVSEARENDKSSAAVPVTAKVAAVPAIDTFPEISKCVVNLTNRLNGAKTFSRRLHEGVQT